MAERKATFGGGCFWCVEAVFKRLRGVSKLVSGYAGGENANPTYKEVCTGNTGHAEVIQITFDDDVLSFDDLLRVFFHTHDPTTLNRQGNDVGTQYRSVVFFHDKKQEEATKRIKEEVELSGYWPDPIVTEISPLPEFYEAEDYHQDYFANNPAQSYCLAVIPPKLKKLEEKFSSLV